jgi:hypothetical protein
LLNKDEMQSFINQDNANNVLWIANSGDKFNFYFSSLPPIDKFKKKGVIVIKLTLHKLTTENASKEVVVVEMTNALLEHLYSVFNDIMSPVM